MISTKDIHWLAGLLEGDGCFTVTTTSSKRYPTIKLHMYDRDIVERVKGILKPRTCHRLSFQQRANRKHPVFQTTLSGDRAVGWMMTLYPLMGQRRQARIRELLEMWASGNQVSAKTRHTFNALTPLTP